MTKSSSSEDTFPHEICIYFPIAYDPVDRSTYFEDPLRRLLPYDLAVVDGGGTWVHGASDVWIFCCDLAITLMLVRDEIIRLGAPDGTQLQYRIGTRPIYDELVNGEWHVGRDTLRSPLEIALAFSASNRALQLAGAGR